jgi:hypothetical protein
MCHSPFATHYSPFHVFLKNVLVVNQWKIWINNPKDTSPTPVGERPNSEFVEHAKRICPGVQVVITRDLNPSDIVKTDDSYELPLSRIRFLV